MAFWESGLTSGFCHQKIHGELRKDYHLAKICYAAMQEDFKKKALIVPGLLVMYKVCVAFVFFFHDLTLVVAMI